MHLVAFGGSNLRAAPPPPLHPVRGGLDIADIATPSDATPEDDCRRRASSGVPG